MKNLIRLLALSLFFPIAAQAELSQKFGDIEVHYNALATSELRPEIAKNYKIDRSQNRGLVTISVLKKNNLGVAQPIQAELGVNAANLNSQLTNIDMREVREGGAIYYLGEYRLSPPDTLKFTVTVKPQGATASHKVEFQQKFYR